MISNNTDIISLATFTVSLENLEVNKKILETNLNHFQEVRNQSERQAVLLEKIIDLLEAKK